MAKTIMTLKSCLRTVKLFRGDTGVEFALDICTKITLQDAKFKTSYSVVPDAGTVIKKKNFMQEEKCKCLGIDEGSGFQHASRKENICIERYRRIPEVLNSESQIHVKSI